MCVIDQLNDDDDDDDDDVVDACADDGPEPEVPAVQLTVDRPPPRAELADLEGTDENPQRTRDGEQQLLQVPVSAVSTTAVETYAGCVATPPADHNRSNIRRKPDRQTNKRRRTDRQPERSLSSEDD